MFKPLTIIKFQRAVLVHFIVRGAGNNKDLSLVLQKENFNSRARVFTKQQALPIEMSYNWKSTSDLNYLVFV